MLTAGTDLVFIQTDRGQIRMLMPAPSAISDAMLMLQFICFLAGIFTMLFTGYVNNFSFMRKMQSLGKT